MLGLFHLVAGMSRDRNARKRIRREPKAPTSDDVWDPERWGEKRPECANGGGYSACDCLHCVAYARRFAIQRARLAALTSS